MKPKKLLKIIFFLSLLGILISLYLTNIHYSENKSICDINKVLSCSTVSKSEHANFFGIPVAIFGILGYSMLGFLGINRYKKYVKSLAKSKYLFYFSLLALIISIYLTYTEFFIIKAICLFCIISQVVILGIVVLSYWFLQIDKKRN
jgi:uncharacterized membrane protein